MCGWICKPCWNKSKTAKNIDLEGCSSHLLWSCCSCSRWICRFHFLHKVTQNFKYKVKYCFTFSFASIPPPGHRLCTLLHHNFQRVCLCRTLNLESRSYKNNCSAFWGWTKNPWTDIILFRLDSRISIRLGLVGNVKKSVWNCKCLWG